MFWSEALALGFIMDDLLRLIFSIAAKSCWLVLELFRSRLGNYVSLIAMRKRIINQRMRS
jgi:hypothetical protein